MEIMHVEIEVIFMDFFGKFYVHPRQYCCRPPANIPRCDSDAGG